MAISFTGRLSYMLLIHIRTSWRVVHLPIVCVWQATKRVARQWQSVK